ncbi:hypothetical protein [Pseudoalteromonas gelatinilytica]
MKGIYLNTQLPEIPDVFSETLKVSEVTDNCVSVHNPEYFYESETLKICGWFIYGGKLNDVQSLKCDIESLGLEAIKRVEFGVYSGLFIFKGEKYFFQDKTGLNYHFMSVDSDEIIIAPILKAIEQVRALTISSIHQSILDKRGHLFGTFTHYNEVSCLPAGAIVSLKSGEIVFQSKLRDLCAREPESFESIPNKIKNIIECFPQEKRCLALSGGFDSRLILKSIKYAIWFLLWA